MDVLAEVGAGAVMNTDTLIFVRVDMLTEAVIDALVGMLTGIITDVLANVGDDTLPGANVKVSGAMITTLELTLTTS